MLPIPKGTEEERKQGTRLLTCPYCEGNPNVKVFTDESLIFQNDSLDKSYNKKHNYEKGLFCEKCKTTWFWSNTPDSVGVWDTYVGNVPRVRELVLIGGKAYQNFLPIKDWETKQYMPLLSPHAPLVKKPHL